MKKVFVSGLVNVESSIKNCEFPMPYSPIEYSFNGINSCVSGVGFNVSLAFKKLGDDVDLKVIAKNTEYKKTVDLTAEWDKVCEASLAQGCVVARTEYIKQNPEIINEFLEFNELSVNYLLSNPESAALFLTEKGFFDSPNIALDAMPGCNIVFITGVEMKNAVKQVFEVLYQADPASVGGSVPDDGIYYGA